MSWRSFVGKKCWLQKYLGEMELEEERVEFMGSKDPTIVGKIVANIFHHEHF